MLKLEINTSKQPITLYAILVCVSLLLNGCGSASESDFTPVLSCKNTGVAVNHIEEKWEIEENLSLTLFDDFLKGIQPINSNETLSAVLARETIVALIRKYSGFEGDKNNVLSYKNELDLIHSLINENKIPEIAIGRELMNGCIELDAISKYANWNVAVTNADNSESRLYLVDFNYSKSADVQGDKFLTRTIWERSQPLKNGQEQINLDQLTELAENSSVSIDFYKTKNFTPDGYNKPSKTVASWSDNTGSLDVKLDDEVLQCTDTEAINLTIDKDIDYLGTDVVEYINSFGIYVPELDETIKRIKIKNDYKTGEVSIYKSTFMQAYVGPNGEILTDIKCSELKTLLDAYPDWKSFIVNELQSSTSSNSKTEVINPDREYTYKDPNYDGESATPFVTYTGTLVPHRN